MCKLVLLEGIGLWSRGDADAGIAARIREWSRQTRELAGREPRRYADIETAYMRMQQANPQLSAEQAFHLTQHGAVQPGRAVRVEVRSVHLQLSRRRVGNR